MEDKTSLYRQNFELRKEIRKYRRKASKGNRGNNC